MFIINTFGATNSASATLTVVRNLPRLAIFSSAGMLHISWPNKLGRIFPGNDNGTFCPATG